MVYNYLIEKRIGEKEIMIEKILVWLLLFRKIFIIYNILSIYLIYLMLKKKFRY